MAHTRRWRCPEFKLSQHRAQAGVVAACGPVTCETVHPLPRPKVLLVLVPCPRVRWLGRVRLAANSACGAWAWVREGWLGYGWCCVGGDVESRRHVK